MCSKWSNCLHPDRQSLSWMMNVAWLVPRLPIRLLSPLPNLTETCCTRLWHGWILESRPRVLQDLQSETGILWPVSNQQKTVDWNRKSWTKKVDEVPLKTKEIFVNLMDPASSFELAPYEKQAIQKARGNFFSLCNAQHWLLQLGRREWDVSWAFSPKESGRKCRFGFTDSMCNVHHVLNDENSVYHKLQHWIWAMY